MTDTSPSQPRAGFQGSETSTVEVKIYTKSNDPVLTQSRGIITFKGKRAQDDDASLVAVTTSKVISSPSGQWSITVRPSRSTTFPDLRQLIVDDDWVDITMMRHGRKWHVVRGMVDEVRRIKTVAGSGATSTAYTISGRDFGKVWESTPLWFNLHNVENPVGAVAQRIFGAPESLRSVSVTVQGILQGFMDALGNIGRATFEPPPNVPNTISGNFVRSVVFNVDGFVDNPPRIAIAPQLMDPQGEGIWEVAKEWSDPSFCELWCDLVDAESQQPFTDDSEVPADRAAMGVILRDIPFPTAAQGLNSPWFSLPLHLVPRQAVTDHDIGRGGLERYNAFFVGPQITQALLKNSLELVAPLWDLEDIRLHGMRRFDINTHYVALASNLLLLTTAQREKVRDWYCMNPYLYNGTLALARGFPEIRVGSRIRIPGEQGEVDQETYYVEQVSHSWAFGQGTRTNLGVTRGWIGSDNSYFDALSTIGARHTAPERAAPEEFASA